MEFPNLSFSSELADSTSPQFRLQAQALNRYVSGTAPLPLTGSPLNDASECCLTLLPQAGADLVVALTLISISMAGCCCFFLMPHIQNTAAPPHLLSLLSFFFFFFFLLIYFTLPSLLFFFPPAQHLPLPLSLSLAGSVKCKAVTRPGHSVCAGSRDPQGQGPFRAEDKLSICEPC